MQQSNSNWSRLFLFCLGISASTLFIALWLESDFWVSDEKFSILGLEIFYSKREIVSVLSQIKVPAQLALRYHLIFDYVFMIGAYPAIACLCMMGRNKVSGQSIKTILFALATLQPLAWFFAAFANSYLLGWIAKPEIGDEFSIYRNLVFIKWIVALAGLVLGVGAFVFGKNKVSE